MRTSSSAVTLWFNLKARGACRTNLQQTFIHFESPTHSPRLGVRAMTPRYLLLCWTVLLAVALLGILPTLGSPGDQLDTPPDGCSHWAIASDNGAMSVSTAVIGAPPPRRLRDASARNTSTFVGVLIGTLAPCVLCCLCVQCLCRRKYRSYPPRPPDAPGTTATATATATKDHRRPYSPPAFVKGSEEVRAPDVVDTHAV
jgi:hypothetical protein